MGTAAGGHGAVLAATQGLTPLAADRDAAAATGVGGARPALEVLPLPRDDDTVAVAALAKGERIVAERAAREAEARRPLFVLPAEGAFTSGFGARWGTSHMGIDIANSLGTPIVAAADGVVVASGPASGFGMWVRIEHSDDTITVYGHIHRSLVEEGQQVEAGDEIAEMGNRGQSTGPHLHFEVWSPDGEKINPLTWLNEHGIEF
ncbi:MAG: peptidoglycan DD-metalloendopeptidase family protein [Pseudonocardiaceae bacterium]|nr:peptidoglycan DD-metalloendopeptidase family protein [Pseudonocardiaceae bacterium]